MVMRETVTINGRDFTYTYSGQGFPLRKVGTDEIYDDAIDVLEFEYEETEEELKQQRILELEKELELLKNS